MSFLDGEQVDYFIHSAGFVNLSTDEAAKRAIFKENLDFTKHIFDAYAKYIKKFIYIITAIAVGDFGGILDNDYTIKPLGTHRNS